MGSIFYPFTKFPPHIGQTRAERMYLFQQQREMIGSIVNMANIYLLNGLWKVYPTPPSHSDWIMLLRLVCLCDVLFIWLETPLMFVCFLIKDFLLDRALIYAFTLKQWGRVLFLHSLIRKRLQKTGIQPSIIFSLNIDPLCDQDNASPPVPNLKLNQSH